jgi:hypothetical protein
MDTPKMMKKILQLFYRVIKIISKMQTSVLIRKRVLKVSLFIKNMTQTLQLNPISGLKDQYNFSLVRQQIEGILGDLNSKL